MKAPLVCPDCGSHQDNFVGVQYTYDSPNRYDGVSEWLCAACGNRWGRWTGKLLGKGESEPRFGDAP